MPGVFFHANNASQYFSRHKFFLEEADYRIAYTMLPDALYIHFDHLKFHHTHDYGCLMNVRENTNQPGGDKWIYLMMAHHIALDIVADDTEKGFLNDLEKDIAGKVAHLHMPKFVPGVLMDMALDLALLGYEKEQGGNDTVMAMNFSKQHIDLVYLGDTLVTVYADRSMRSRKAKKQWRARNAFYEFGRRFQEFDFSRMKDVEGYFDALKEYYIKPKASRLAKFSKGQLRHWVAQKAIRLYDKENKRQEMYDIIRKTSAEYMARIGEIHSHALDAIPPPDGLDSFIKDNQK